MRALIGTALALALAFPATASPADDALLALIARDRAADAAERGGTGEEEEERKVAAHLADVTPAAQAARLARLTASAGALAAIDAAGLSPQHQVDAQVYRYALDTRIAGLRFRTYEMPFNSDSSFWSALGSQSRATFRTEQDYRNWIAQLRGIPGWVDDQTANLRAGLARGFTPPKVTLEGRAASLDAIADAGDPVRTSLYAPFRTMPASLPAAVQAELRAQGAAAIGAAIPAFARLRRFLNDDYIPHARVSLAAEALPDGRAFYRA